MRYSYVLIPLIFLVISCVHNSARQENPAFAIQERVSAQTDSLEVLVSKLCQSIELADGNEQTYFRRARHMFKRLEGYAELYAPETTLKLNGPPIDRYDEYDPERSIPPEGFQVVEEYLFPVINETSRDEALLEAKRMQSSIHRLRRMIRAATFDEAHVVEGLRLEVFRIATMGITGFDSPVALESLSEAVSALQGIAESVDVFTMHYGGTEFDNVAKVCSKAQRYLKANTDFNRFNRAQFIIIYLDPILESLTLGRDALGIDMVTGLSALAPHATSVFGAGTIDPTFFVPVYAKPTTYEKQVLGRLLFYDPLLSGNAKRTCATCHQPDKAFTDGLQRSLALHGGTVQRNAPTLVNAGYQSAFFYDMRVTYLEDQVNDVIHNTDEMHGDLDRAVAILTTSEEYKNYFEVAFPGDSVNAISGRNIRIAIAAYIHSLSTLNSKVDRYMRGDMGALTKGELEGFNLFMGKAKCATCHFPPLFNGAIPPRYVETEGEVIGVPATHVTADARIDSDPGRYPLYRMTKDMHLFKIPGVRNAALTGPYMHNGVYKSLEEVVDFYNRGGGAGIGIDLANATLPEDSLMLSSSEIQNIVSFMEALTDTAGLKGAPERLPVVPQYPSVSRNPSAAY